VLWLEDWQRVGDANRLAAAMSGDGKPHPETDPSAIRRSFDEYLMTEPERPKRPRTPFDAQLYRALGIKARG
jgi:hypothetical protein